MNFDIMLNNVVKVKINILTKKIVLIIIAFLYGLNDSSLVVGGFQIPLLRFFLVLLGVVALLEHFTIKKMKNEQIFDKKYFKILLRSYFSKENGFSIFMMSTWLIYALSSFFWVQSILNWRSAINFIVVGFFCTVVFSLFLKTKKDIFQTFQIMGIIAIIHNVIGWYEVLTQNHLFRGYIQWGRRPVSVFYNTNNFAVFLFISIFILYALGERSRNLHLKILYKVMSASSISLVFFTQSRGVIMSVLISLTAFFILSNFEKIKKLLEIKRSRVIFIGTSFLITVAIAMTLFYVFIGNLDISTADRITLVRNGVVFFTSTNGRGVGAGNIEYWMEMHRQFELYRHDMNIHNWWLEILVAYGIVVFSLYIIFYYKLFKSNFLKFAKSTNQIDKSFSKAVMCIMIGFLIASIVPSTLIFHIFHWVFWAVMIAFQGIPLEE